MQHDSPYYDGVKHTIFKLFTSMIVKVNSEK